MVYLANRCFVSFSLCCHYENFEIINTTRFVTWESFIIASCPITTIMVAPGKITANKHLTLTVNSDLESQSPIYHVKRPEDMAINIQRGCPTSRTSIGQPRSPSEVSMNSGSLSEMDYMERMDLQNNTEVEEPKDNSQASNEPMNAVVQPQGLGKAGTQPQEVNKMVSTNISSQAFSSQLSPPEVIPYSTNVLADPSLWDGRFGATFLFGTNKFLQGNILNMVYSPQCMATFLKKKSSKVVMTRTSLNWSCLVKLLGHLY